MSGVESAPVPIETAPEKAPLAAPKKIPSPSSLMRSLSKKSSDGEASVISNASSGAKRALASVKKKGSAFFSRKKLGGGTFPTEIASTLKAEAPAPVTNDEKADEDAQEEPTSQEDQVTVENTPETETEKETDEAPQDAETEETEEATEEKEEPAAATEEKVDAVVATEETAEVENKTRAIDVYEDDNDASQKEKIVCGSQENCIIL
uniref:Uncharacterized protein n=2 Tax=Ditylum brightwellii TaxID=49249 RepID=A0A7S4SVR8_9STRA|mmetsp:Transcript_15582/g.20745  ORF Transcript_15582/g.20745 Transcript_15582/m.20745 type:complete len:207 (+) Transcript_15582:154-774(+)